MPQQLGTTALLCQGPHLQQVLQVISQQFGYWLDSCICRGVIFVIDIHWPAHGEREEGEGEGGRGEREGRKEGEGSRVEGGKEGRREGGKEGGRKAGGREGGREGGRGRNG